MAQRRQTKFKSRSDIPEELQNFGYHLVFSEGTKTEPYYIENIKNNIANKYKISKGQIDIHCHVEEGSYNTTSLVQFAKRKVKEIRNSGIKVDHVWIFYDRDDFKKLDFDSAHFEIINNNKKSHQNSDGDNCDKYGTVWHSCWSNESFELWILLHFENCHSALNRKEYISKINSYISDKRYGLYQKSNRNIYDMIVLNNGSMSNAIRYAKTLDDNNHNSRENPSTGVYTFANYFLKYLEKSTK